MEKEEKNLQINAVGGKVSRICKEELETDNCIVYIVTVCSKRNNDSYVILDRGKT